MLERSRRSQGCMDRYLVRMTWTDEDADYFRDEECRLTFIGIFSEELQAKRRQSLVRPPQISITTLELSRYPNARCVTYSH
jgi:hypothetical protein